MSPRPPLRRPPTSNMTSTRTQFRNSLLAISAAAVILLGVAQVLAATPVTSASKTPVPAPVVQVPMPASVGITFGALPDQVAYGDFVVGPGKIELTMNPGDT